VEEIPGAIRQGETIEEARENLADALRMVLECNRELAREAASTGAVRETLEFASL
jgi:predicted RNase H-like HicB family nuclease